MLTAAQYRIDRKLLLVWLALSAGAGVSLLAAYAVWSFTPARVFTLFFAIMFAVLLALAPDKRRFVLAAVLFVVPLNIDQNFILHPSPGGADSISFGLFEIFLFFLFVVTLLRMAQAKEAGAFRLFPAVFAPSIAILAFYLISLANARDLLWSLFDIVNFIKVILFFLLLANNINSEKDLKIVLIALFLGLIAQAFIAAWQNMNPDITDAMLRFKLGVSPKVVQEQGLNPFVRSGGTLGNANHLGRYLGLILPTAIILVLSPVSGRSLKMMSILASLFGAVAVINTMSRSAWAGLALSVLVMLPFMLKHRLFNFRSLFKMSVAAMVMALFLFLFGDKIWARLTLDDHGSAMTRITTSKVAFRIIQDHPFIGCGINNYGAMLPDYWLGEDAFTRKAAVHNNYLLYASEIGILGFTAFIWLLVSFGIRIAQAMKSRSPFFSAVAISIMGAFAGMLLMSLSDKSYKENFSLLLTFWALMAIIEAIIRMNNDKLLKRI